MNIGYDLRAIIGKPLFGSGAPAGVAGYAIDMLGELVAQGDEHEFFCFSNSLKKPDLSLIRDILHKPNVHLVTMRVPNKLFDPVVKLFGYPKTDRVIEKAVGVKLDAYFSPHFNITRLSPGIKHVMAIHDLSFEIYPEFYGVRKQYWHWVQSVKESCERADAIIAVSEHTKNDLVTLYGVDEEKVHVVYSGVQFADSSKEQGSELYLKVKYNLPDNYFLYLGTLEPRKNIESIIEAFDEYYARHPGENVVNDRISLDKHKDSIVDRPENGQLLQSDRPHLVIAGGNGWKYKRIYKTAQKATHKDKIHFIGYIDAADKAGLIKHAKAFIFPSFYEGFGFPPLEALSQGTPVITSHTSSLPEVVRQNALYVNPYNVNDIKNAITDVWVNIGHKRPICEGALSWKFPASSVLEVLTKGLFFTKTKKKFEH